MPSFYSLWLRTKSPELTRLLESIILHESRSKPGTCAPFDPHVTLFSLSNGAYADFPIEKVVKRTRDAVQLWREREGRKQGEPLPLFSRGVGIGDEFWQSVYLTMQQDASLTALRREIGAAFPFPPAPGSYFPHLSLVYGDLPSDLRKGITDEIMQRWGAELIGEMTFDRIEIWLCTSEKTTLGWRKAGQVAL